MRSARGRGNSVAAVFENLSLLQCGRAGIAAHSGRGGEQGFAQHEFTLSHTFSTLYGAVNTVDAKECILGNCMRSGA